jgi:putative ubiquitin-RnfH superfamily antitoxin RatB of RatAB toxin-antitoxin module
MFMAIDGKANQALAVEVAYATPHKQRLVSLLVPTGACVGHAIQASGLLGEFPEIDLSQAKVGIFGSVCDLGQLLKPGDRVEIYRPLVLDPKAARLQRAAK